MKGLTLKLLTLLLMVCLCGCTAVKRPNYEKLDYRYDIEPIAASFPFFQDIETVYWKAGRIGSSSIGPNSTAYKAFLIISDDEYATLTNEYILESCFPVFDQGIDPTITGYTTFEWAKNDELSRKLLAFKYVGNIYFDQINGIIYIDVETT